MAPSSCPGPGRRRRRPDVAVMHRYQTGTLGIHQLADLGCAHPGAASRLRPAVCLMSSQARGAEVGLVTVNYTVHLSSYRDAIFLECGEQHVPGARREPKQPAAASCWLLLLVADLACLFVPYRIRRVRDPGAQAGMLGRWRDVEDGRRVLSGRGTRADRQRLRRTGRGPLVQRGAWMRPTAITGSSGASDS